MCLSRRAQFAGPLAQASEPLGTFLDYCTYGHMIDNVSKGCPCLHLLPCRTCVPVS